MLYIYIIFEYVIYCVYIELIDIYFLCLIDVINMELVVRFVV